MEITFNVTESMHAPVSASRLSSFVLNLPPPPPPPSPSLFRVSAGCAIDWATAAACAAAADPASSRLDAGVCVLLYHGLHIRAQEVSFLCAPAAPAVTRLLLSRRGA